MKRRIRVKHYVRQDGTSVRSHNRRIEKQRRHRPLVNLRVHSRLSKYSKMDIGDFDPTELQDDVSALSKDELMREMNKRTPRYIKEAEDPMEFIVLNAVNSAIWKHKSEFTWEDKSNILKNNVAFGIGENDDRLDAVYEGVDIPVADPKQNEARIRVLRVRKILKKY